MKENKSAAEFLCACAAEDGILNVLAIFFPKGTIVRIPCMRSVCEQSVDNLELSPRAYHCLMRANIRTIRELVDSLESQSIMKIRNLGAKSAAEIRRKLLAFSYEALSEPAKVAFWAGMLKR